MKLYIGTSGYFYWEWRGKFYPEDLKPSKWFYYYSKFFNTIEINSTFYRFPSKKSLRNWYRISPENFSFSVKVNRVITHIKKLKSKDELNAFYKICEENLQEKLSNFLFQFPSSFKYSKENLNILVNTLESKYNNVVEFRDSSWFKKVVFDTLRKNKIIFCCISAPKLNDICINTARTVYVRFHGKNSWYRYKYSDTELKKWVEKILSLNPEKVFLYFNNTYKGYAVENALKIKDIFESDT